MVCFFTRSLKKMNNNNYCFLDLFAGAGGLSEGFIKAGYSSVAHVELSKAACNTLKTRTAFHWLKKHNRESEYYDYLYRKMTRTQLYNLIPRSEIHSVINAEIGENSLPEIFRPVQVLSLLINR